MSLVGRKKEINILNQMLNSGKAEFLALYGRRRIGKTYLIREFFKQKDVLFFNATGAKEGTLLEQLTHFTEQLSKIFYGNAELKVGKSWDETFNKLTKALETGVHKNQKIVLFFDELPWMATKNSRLLSALDYYWNQHWSNNSNIKLIICGSSSSWIIRKIIKNKGGLHNRITERMVLEPFNLRDTQQFLEQSGVKLNREQILLIYMAMGGVPYYLSKVKRGLSAAQVIESLAFTKQAFLLEEFEHLFPALFDDGEIYMEIVKQIGRYREGIGQRKLLEKLGKTLLGGGGIKKLRELEEAGFIESFKPLLHRKKGIYYRLLDEYLIFYLQWINPIRDTLQNQSLEPGNWQSIQNTPAWYSWSGYAFEAICYKHLTQIRQKLRIAPNAIAGSWRFSPRKNPEKYGAQIDLLFDRKDQAMTICEIKYSIAPYILTKEDVAALNRKVEVFRSRTRIKKQIFLVMVAVAGIKNNYYADDILSGIVTLDDLFEDVP
jgi:uncharacterized protein